MNQFSCLTEVPAMTKGLVRELRVRWMLEELGLPYEPVSYPHPDTKKEPYLKLQPFGQVPYFKADGLQMFETGAILIHLALKYKKLLPADEVERAKTLQWMFAAQTSVEPWLWHRLLVKWDPESTEGSLERSRQLAIEKLGVLSKSLGEREYFGPDFSIAEIVMTTVLRTAKFGGLLDDMKNLCAYLERNEARPAFQRALNEHAKLYEEK